MLSLIEGCSDLTERDLQLSSSYRKVSKQEAFANAIMQLSEQKVLESERVGKEYQNKVK